MADLMTDYQEKDLALKLWIAAALSLVVIVLVLIWLTGLNVVT